MSTAKILRAAAVLAAFPLAVLAQNATTTQAATAAAERVHANWQLANRYSQSALRTVAFGGAVTPRWLGKSEFALLQLQGQARLAIQPRCANDVDEAAPVRS